MTKPLILAIEPDPHKALQLKSIARQVNAELRLASSMSDALAAFSERVPDLILIPALLVARDDLALTERLRKLGDAAAHIQTLTIPILETADMTLFGSGVFGTPRRPRPNLGCEAGTFAEQVGIYLGRASEARQRYSPPPTPSDVHNRASVDETPPRNEEPALMNPAPPPAEMRAGMDEMRPPVEEPSVVNAAPPWVEEFIDIDEGALLPAGELAAADETPLPAEVSFDMESEPLPPAGELSLVGKTPRSVEVSFDMEGEPLPPVGELAATDDTPPSAERYFHMEEALPAAGELRVVDQPDRFRAPDFAGFFSEELLAPESIPSIAAPQPMVGDSPTVFFRQIKAAISNSLPDATPQELLEFPSEDPSVIVAKVPPASDALADLASEGEPDVVSEEMPQSDGWQLLDPAQDRFAALIVKLDAIAVNGV